MAYCGQCGTSVVGAFCGNCGARTSHPDTPIAPTRDSLPTPAAPTQPTQPIEAVSLQKPAGANVVSHPTVALDPIRFEPAPTVTPWAASRVRPSLPPPQTPPVQPPQTPPVQPALSPRRSSRWLIVAILAAVLLLAGGGYGAAKLTFLKETPTGSPLARAGTSAPATNTAVAAPKASPTITPGPVAVPATRKPIPTIDPGVAAKAQLESLVTKDAVRPTVRGQWVAQLSSKSEGIVDKTLQPGPFTVPQILSEHLALRGDPSFGSFVRLVHLGDWGTRSAPSSPMWVTVADIDAASAADVAAWCEAHFSQRGKALDNVCLASRLTRKSR